ncbi:uncharacterized protein LOC134253732 [Saccostrea cucullata]|uniref:uncharacterized protein LOC134253732 n=1 Tax=Saccostrea cuccullata TaxID=36930 RepID=UPI002ED31E03
MLSEIILYKYFLNISGPDVSDTEVNTLDNEDEVFLLSDSEKTEGFDQSSFESVIRKYKLQSVEKIFKENEIDCIRSFVDLSANDLENLGLKIGQIKKCLSVIKILNNRNRKTVSANNITGRKLDYSLAENLQSLPNVF